jgi:DNA-binding transcriptional LysR family regulator
MLNSGRLRLLVELEERGSVTAVADALDFTPSAVSQQLTRLEAETGHVLSERAGRGVLLTDAGRVLAAHGRGVLERIEAAEAALETSAVPAGRLRVAAFQTAARALVVPAFAKLAARYSALSCELRDLEAETALPLLASGELDAVVAEEYEHAPRPRDSRSTRHELGEDELLVALPSDHALAATSAAVNLADLADEVWATPWTNTAYTTMIESACRVAGFEPQVGHRVSDLGTLLELARHGLAVALVPSLGGAGEGAGLALRPVASGGLKRALFLAVRRSSAERPALSAFVDQVRGLTNRV